MEIDYDKIDDTVLALLHFTSFEEQGVTRSWKGFDWDTLDRLCEKGMINNPKSTAKSVVLSEVGAQRARELFKLHFEKTK